ncbi:MAG: cell wall hydrolase [Lachnospiraceae bacterium]|nr:cell wall hydrolase [Lachnospiraceae bacterium]
MVRQKLKKAFRRNYRSGFRALSLALIFSMSVPTLSYAKTSEDQKKINELNEKQEKLNSEKKNQNSTLKDLKKNKNQAQGKVNTINGNISNVEAELDKAKNDVVKTSEDISKLSNELEEASENEKKQYKALKSQLAYMYENSLTDNLVTILFSSGSISEFLTRAEYAMAIAKYDNDLIESYKEIQTTIKTKSKELAQKQKDLASYQEVLTAKQSELNTELQGAQAELIKSSEAVDMQQANIDEIDKQISGYKAETQAIEARVQAANEAAMQRFAEEKAREKAEAEAIANQKQKEADEAKQRGDADADQKQREADEARQEADNASHIATSEGRAYNNPSELNLLAAIIQAEAGNQGYDGMFAVGSVIMNRVFDRQFPGTITGVVYANNQFEPVTRKMVVRRNGGYVELNMTVLQYYLSNPSAVSANARSAAQATYNGQRYHCPFGAMNQLFFMTPAALESSRRGWMAKKTIADQFTLKGHTFFNVL